MGRRSRIWLTIVLALSMVAGQLPSYVLGSATRAAAAGGAISGRVTDAATTNPLPSVRVRVINADGVQVGTAITDASGRFTVVVADGGYHVYYDGAGYAPQAYNLQRSALTAATVTVAGAAVTGVDAALTTAHYVSGIVSDASGIPLQGVGVDAYINTDGPAHGCCFLVAGTTTASDGSYNIGLAAGATYKLRFAANTPLEQWWNGRPNPGNNVVTGWTTADSFTVDPVAGQCSVDSFYIFNNWTGGTATNGGTPPTLSPEGQYCLRSISTYHWNGGSGTDPVANQGTIKLTSGATVLGPYAAAGSAGQTGAPNVNWTAGPPAGQVVVLKGTYTCIDSFPSTWSYDAAVSPAGFCRVSASPYTPGSDGRPNTDATLTAPDVLFGVNSADDGLSRYNEATGAATFIGRLDPDTTKLTTPIALAARPSDKTLFAWNNSAPDGVLLTIDRCSGLASAVNPNAAAQGAIADIAFAADGKLYGVDYDLSSIDPVTGIKSSVGSLGQNIRAGGAAFDPASGVLYGLELTISAGPRLVTINTSTGAATVIGALSVEVGVVGAIAFDPNGVLIGSASGGLGNVLFDINKANAAVSNVRTVGGAYPPQGMAFAPVCGTADIRTTLTALPAPATLGRDMTFTGAVFNAGPDTATNVNIRIQLPPGIDYTGGTSTRGACRKTLPFLGLDTLLVLAPQTVLLSCDVGLLAAGASATITIPATPLVVGSFTALAHARADQTDLVATNNDASFAFVVRGRNNHTWTTAQYLPLTGGSESVGSIAKYADTDYISRTGQPDWYKIHIAPGQKVLVKLTGVGGNVALPADYSLALYKDIKAYLLRTQTAVAADPLRAIQNHDASTSPDALSPDALSPDALSPDALSPDALSPDALSPDALSPDALSPDELSPDELSPDALSPDALSPDALSPDALSPDALSPDAYSGAQTATILRVSAHQGTSPEQIIQNTWTNTGDFYLRVRGHNGAADPTTPFQITAELAWTACSNVNLPAATPILPLVSGTPKTVIITNTARFGTADTSALIAGLNALKGRGEVSGVTIDLATTAADPYGLKAAYDNWDAHPTCPGAANVVADGIKQIVDRYRASLQYVVLAGGDHVIPYYRTPDQAGLGNEQGFQPGLHQDTPGEASLRFGYTLTQDFYGTRAPITRFDHSFFMPDLAVGRLVETPSDIVAVINAYISAAGVVHIGGGKVLDTGYDFLSDTAKFVQDSLSPAMTVDPLIQARHPEATPPFVDAPWTADQLRAKLFAQHYGIASLNGHFSANTLLAADFATRVTSSEIAANSSLFLNTLVVSTGCHSGFNIVDPEALANTNNVDWPQAFARAGAQVIGSTGYGYGDTDFIKYTELVVANFTTELRYGAAGEAVAIGTALMNAKRSYAASLPALRGIDEKALMEATLYGLPMWSIDLGASGRLSRPLTGSGIQTLALTPPVTGLSSATITLAPSLHRNPTSGNPVTGVYYDVGGNVAVSPAAPVLPLTMQPIGIQNANARGVVLTDATYADEAGVTPFTDVPVTELSGLHPGFSSPVFTPVRTFELNSLSGSQTFLTTPAQFKSTGANSATLRTWTNETFKVFYSTRIDASAALAGSPVVYSVTSEVTGAHVTFHVVTGALADPGLAGAYLTYTAETGPLYGKWHSEPMTFLASEDVTQLDANHTPLATIRHYSFEVDPGQGVSVDDVRAFVQVVGGNGLVSMTTNDGSYYRVTHASVGTPTVTTLAISAPPSGAYLTKVAVQATLSGGGTGLPVALSLGHQRSDVLTDANGVARASFTIRTLPGDTTLTATFVGDDTHLGSSAIASFHVGPGTPTLTAGVSTIQYTESDLVATLGVGGRTDPQSVTLTANGITIAGQSDALGHIRLDTRDLLQAGPNSLTVAFAGNDRFAPLSLTTNVTLTAEDALITLPSLSPVPVGPLTVTAQVTEAADGTTGDLTRAVITWLLRNELGNPAQAPIQTSPTANGNASVTFQGVTAGIYHVEATVGSAPGAYYYASPPTPVISTIAVVYDTSTFVTGGGWVLTTTDSKGLVAGKKANFGFNAKYKAGTAIPTGSVEFTAKESNVSFKATGFDWLVIAGGRAELQGTGTINAIGAYTFRLIAVDGSPDTFEIRIWNGSGSFDLPLYRVAASPGGGNIVVH